MGFAAHLMGFNAQGLTGSVQLGGGGGAVCRSLLVLCVAAASCKFWVDRGDLVGQA
jgi:hypothetical protein